MYRHYCFGGPIQDYRHQYLAIALGPFMNINIVTLLGLFRIIVIIIQQWLWADSYPLTLLLWWDHLGLSTPVFGGGSGPIQDYQFLYFTDCRPIQYLRPLCLALDMGPFMLIKSQYSALAVGTFKTISGNLLYPWLTQSTMLPVHIYGPNPYYATAFT